MSLTRFAGILSAAVLAGWAASASAADYDYGRSGPYLGAGGTYAIQAFRNDALGTSAAPLKAPANSWGYNIKGGYRFNEYFAVEADWDHLLGFNNSTGDTKIWNIGANGKLYPFHGMVQPFVSAGVGWSGVNDGRATTKKIDQTGIGGRFGAGVDVYLTRNWALTAECAYLLPLNSRSGYDSIPITLGFIYRFY